ncbi:transketolase [Streptomyces sp. NPDC002088]|uniref:transketolase n=1 Tax=Streptomyces sp. NPDC002088 TaxID=3154665 RepID=UPI003322CF28
MNSAGRALSVRRHIVEMAATAAGTHLGGSLSAADILVALYFDVMRVDPRRPDRPDRDRFILSKGHAAAALYAVLAERGFIEVRELAEYGRAGSRLGSHPTKGLPGVEFPTGSLGHGLALGTGLALAARRDGRDSRTFVLLGDGELQEGSVWEAASTAGRLGLDGLVAIVDHNRLQINGSTEEYGTREQLSDRWRSFGWQVRHVPGHDAAELCRVLSARPDPASQAPTVVIADTVKGRGIAFMEHHVNSHYAVLSPRLRKRALASLERSARRSGGSEEVTAK